MTLGQIRIQVHSLGAIRQETRRLPPPPPRQRDFRGLDRRCRRPPGPAPAPHHRPEDRRRRFFPPHLHFPEQVTPRVREEGGVPHPFEIVLAFCPGPVKAATATSFAGTSPPKSDRTCHDFRLPPRGGTKSHLSPWEKGRAWSPVGADLYVFPGAVNTHQTAGPTKTHQQIQKTGKYRKIQRQ